MPDATHTSPARHSRALSLWLIVIVGYFLARLADARLSEISHLSEHTRFLIISFPEMLVWLAIVLSLPRFIFNWRPAVNLMPKSLLVSSLLFFSYLLGLFYLAHYPVNQVVIGLRNGLLWIPAFFCFLGTQVSPVRLKRLWLILTTTLFGLLAIEIISGPLYLQRLGLLSSATPFGYGAVHHTGRFLQTMLSVGPNQLAALITILSLPVLYHLLKHHPVTAGSFWLLTLIALGTTESRSGLLAFLICSFAALILSVVKRTRYWLFGLSLVLILLFAGLANLLSSTPSNSQLVSDLILHGPSTSKHLESLQQSATIFETSASTERLFGHGPGTATYSQYTKLLPESYPLAIWYEYGLFGLVLWLSIIISIILSLVDLRTTLSQSALLSLSAFLLMNLILQPFADNPTAVYLLFGAIALILSQPKSTLKTAGQT